MVQAAVGTVSSIRETFNVFPRSVLWKWGLIISISSVAFLPWTLVTGGEPLDSLFSVARYVGMHLGTGLPVVAGASILGCSEGTKRAIVEKDASGRTTRLRTLFAGCFVLTLLAITLVTLFRFWLTVAVTGWTDILSFIPQMLGVACFLTGLLCPIALGLALAVDSPKISMFAGLGSFCVLLLTTFQIGFAASRPEVAFFSPAHLLPALLFIITLGAESPYLARYYVGLQFTPLELILPLLTLVLASVVSYRVCIFLYESDLKLWRVSSDQWLSEAEPVTEKQDQERRGDVSQLISSLHARRRDAEVAVLLFVLLMPLAGFGYVSFVHTGLTVVLYESPAEGETIEIGEWRYDWFEGIEPEQGTYLAVLCEGQILAGGGSGGSTTVNFACRMMTLIELQHMNETELEDMFGGGTCSYGSSTSFRASWGGPEHEGAHVWVLRFLDVGGQTYGAIAVRFRVAIVPVQSM